MIGTALSRFWISCGVAFFALAAFSLAYAGTTITIYQTAEKGPGKSLGTVTVTQSTYGLLLTPNLHGLPPGLHGFHIHVMASCDHAGMGAGGHLDPAQVDQHNGPYVEKSHLGDLPGLYVDQHGDATLPVLAPRLQLSDLKNHTVMIHAGGDNYADHPEKLGGGGARIACGVISE